MVSEIELPAASVALTRSVTSTPAGAEYAMWNCPPPAAVSVAGSQVIPSLKDTWAGAPVTAGALAAGVAPVGEALKAGAMVARLVVAERGEVEDQRVAGPDRRRQVRQPLGARQADVGGRVQRVPVPVLGQLLAGPHQPPGTGLAARSLPLAGVRVLQVRALPEHRRAGGKVL